MPERAYRKMVISLKRNSTFVEAAQFCNCCILFSGLSAPPVTCPYRAEQATGLAGGYDCNYIKSNSGIITIALCSDRLTLPYHTQACSGFAEWAFMIYDHWQALIAKYP